MLPLSVHKPLVYDGEMPVFVLEPRQEESARDQTPGEQCVINVLIEEGNFLSAALLFRVNHRESFDVASRDPRIHASVNPAMLTL